MLKGRSHRWLLGLLWSLSFHSAAQPPTIDFEQAKQTLNLTEEQYALFVPIIEDSIEARQSILSRHGVEFRANGRTTQSVGMRQALGLRRDMTEIDEKTLALLQEVLDVDQLRRFEQMQQDQKAAMKSRLRGAN